MIKSAIQQIYDSTIRNYLPRYVVAVAGIPVPKARLLDVTLAQPDYKRGLIEAVYDHVESKDVDMVGLGWGVSAVHCVRAGATRVDAYEAAGEMIEKAEQTFAVCAHDETDRIVSHHALVGDSLHIYGEDMGDVVSVEDLTADILILDCEGAEMSIFDYLEDWPTKVIVETHPKFDAPTNKVMEKVQQRYDTVEEYEYEPNHEGDKRVLVGY